MPSDVLGAGDAALANRFRIIKYADHDATWTVAASMFIAAMRKGIAVAVERTWPEGARAAPWTLLRSLSGN
jgi:hypothetical protein